MATQSPTRPLALRWLAAASLLAVGLVGGCGSSDDSPQPEPRATWYQDVAPMLSAHCNGCHAQGGIGPFPLNDYDTAKAHAAQMLAEVDRGAMPPFDAREDADCTPRFGWVDDPRLSAEQKATLHNWVEDGFALGEVAEIPPPRSVELPNISKTMTPVEGFAASGERDQFVCYILDPEVTAPITWLTGLQVRPDIAEVVHHAVISESLAGPELDQLIALRGIGKPFDCGTATAPSNFVVHIWTPGNQPMQTQPEIAVPILAGAKLVMQVHYHAAGRTHAPDKTAVDLQFSSVWPRKMYFVAAAGNIGQAPALLPGPGDTAGPEFRVPAGSPDHPEHMRITLPALGGAAADPRIFSVNPHMHLVGTHISATLERPAARGNDPQQECLANGAWNFDWQRTYTYDTPLDNLPSVAAGDILDIKCKFDNTISNPFVQRMLKDSNLPPTPIDVRLGEQTTDEMCLEIFGVAINAPARPALDAPVVMPDMTGFGLNPNLFAR
ncbi:MAG: hypothetical protein R3B48_15090 [Kofleriaceae bacterium]